ncbi:MULTISPECIES: HIT family protein [Vitreoscilla]|uniref:HIT domain-containing protein n=1 Tax=Vitreoscilla stercoraria TaxID=61 RepID=A0ABY4EDD1_VITST|nr:MULTISPECIES: HIT domain-containing protein [Vitreoscilla]AUZ05474.1 putative histidine triad family protein [Vitreoscilla sp. C1]UOO93229.1 HIT domain-containing protein [Vitreoscilla stercoraria]
MAKCPLCQTQGETILYQDEMVRVILVTDQVLTPAYCRVIWQDHVAEMTDLTESQRQYLMHVVYQVETIMRDIFNPIKINLASFGTMVPHQHWHVIARFEDDAYYPDSIWSSPRHHHVPKLPDNWRLHLTEALNA